MSPFCVGALYQERKQRKARCTRVFIEKEMFIQAFGVDQWHWKNTFLESIGFPSVI